MQTCQRDKLTHYSYKSQHQSFYKYRLTPMKSPHLLSHEMTGQVDSGALDQFLTTRTSYRIQLLSPSARPSSVFSGRMGCDTVFALPATLSTASSLESTPTNGRRITLQQNMSVATRPTLSVRRLAPRSTLACPKHHVSSSHQ